MRPTLVVLFVVLSYIPMLPGAEYFISPSGNDQASGSKEAPLASVIFNAKIAPLAGYAMRGAL